MADQSLPPLPEPHTSLLSLAALACSTKAVADVDTYWDKALEVANTIDFEQPIPPEVVKGWEGYGPDDNPPEVPPVALALLNSMRSMVKAGLDTRTMPNGVEPKKRPVYLCMLKVAPWVHELTGT